MYPRACSTVREEGLTELTRTEDMGQRSAHDSQQFPVPNSSTFVSVALLALQILQFKGTSSSLQSNGENKGNICHFIHYMLTTSPTHRMYGDSNYRHVIFWTILTSLKRAKMLTFYFSNCIMASKIVFEILR